jgi:hypothetical protein
MLRAIKKHVKHAILQQYSCGALRVLRWSDLMLQKCIKDKDGADVMGAAVNASGATAVCKYLGQNLLKRLKEV